MSGVYEGRIEEVNWITDRIPVDSSYMRIWYNTMLQATQQTQ